MLCSLVTISICAAYDIASDSKWKHMTGACNVLYVFCSLSLSAHSLTHSLSFGTHSHFHCKDLMHYVKTSKYICHQTPSELNWKTSGQLISSCPMFSLFLLHKSPSPTLISLWLTCSSHLKSTKTNLISKSADMMLREVHPPVFTLNNHTDGASQGL